MANRIRVKSYAFNIPETTMPQHVYVEDGYDVSRLPKVIRDVIKDAKVCLATVDIEGIFGPSGKKFFDRNHFVDCRGFYEESIGGTSYASK